MQHLDGVKAEQFMRFRQYNNGRVTQFYDGSDLKRIAAQQGFVKEFIKQKANLYYITRVNEILSVVFDNIETNVTFNEISRELGNIRNVDIGNIETFMLPGVTSGTTPSYYICSIKKTMDIIRSNFDTGDLVAKWDDNKFDDEEYSSTVNRRLQQNPSNAETEIKNSGIEAP